MKTFNLILVALCLLACLTVRAATPSTLPYGLTVTGGSFTVTLTGTNRAVIGTNDISTVVQAQGDSGLVFTNSGTKFTGSFNPSGITNNGALIMTNGSGLRVVLNNTDWSTNIFQGTTYGAAQFGYNINAAVAISNSVAARQHGYFRSGLFAINTAMGAQMNIDGGLMNAVASNLNQVLIGSSGDAGEISLSVLQNSSSTGGVRVLLNGSGGKIMGTLNQQSGGNQSSATNSGAGSLLLLNLIHGEHALVTGAEAIGMGAVTITNDQALVAGDGRVSHGTGSITADSFWGNGANLTNIGAASLSITAITAIASTRYESSATNFVTLTNANGTAYPVACLTNGTSGGGGGSVTLRTNYLIRVPSHPGAWARSTEVGTNGALAIAMEQFATTARAFRASLRTSGSLTNQTTTIYGQPWALSAVASNHGTISVVYDAAAGATGVISFVQHDATNVLLSFTLTTSGVYSASGTNFAGARIIDTDISATVTGQGGTNYGRFWIPDVYGAEQ